MIETQNIKMYVVNSEKYGSKATLLLTRHRQRLIVLIISEVNYFYQRLQYICLDVVNMFNSNTQTVRYGL